MNYHESAVYAFRFSDPDFFGCNVSEFEVVPGATNEDCYQITSVPPTASTPLSSPKIPRSLASPQGSSRNAANSQAGHKCELISPTTGKPCEKSFSRQSHLTRHQTTVHNRNRHICER